MPDIIIYYSYTYTTYMFTYKLHVHNSLT